MPRKQNLVGQTFGRLHVVAPAEASASGFTRWLCRCECGSKVMTYTNGLRSGHTKSCGCLQRETVAARNQTHGRSASRVYMAWAAMRDRCGNPNNGAFDNYGARGIKVCERWQLFENFIADMGERPAGTTLERKDNAGHYEPGNCVWANAETQANNKRSNRFIEHEGRRLTLAQWARKLGLTRWRAARVLGVLRTQL